MYVYTTISNYSDWLRAGRSGFGNSITGGGWEFFSSPQRPDWLWSPTSFLLNGYRGLSPRE